MECQSIVSHLHSIFPITGRFIYCLFQRRCTRNAEGQERLYSFGGDGRVSEWHIEDNNNAMMKQMWTNEVNIRINAAQVSSNPIHGRMYLSGPSKDPYSKQLTDNIISMYTISA